MSTNEGVYVPGVYVPGQDNNNQQAAQASNTGNGGDGGVYVPNAYVPSQGAQSSYVPSPAAQAAYVPSPAAQSSVHASYTQPTTTTSTRPPAWASASAPPGTSERAAEHGESTQRPIPNSTAAAAAGTKVTDKEMRAEFDLVDVDNNGYLDVNDFKKIFGSLVSRAMITKAIGMVDKNKDNKISFDEYKQMRSQFGPLPVKIPNLGKK
ncbi:expressed unknown protein [Seminavis robusta]|uniref:EF-hand domain-containing protein n=1 Tax=Seminavis robusta TaxID=568900 RepID=A0A9N8EDH9_9STRA|nr:expressed unknown protein [Seminavis robusta]|eukprot:Sro1017_g231750.1 n/a (208) ;mRNA; r:17636-18259